MPTTTFTSTVVARGGLTTNVVTPSTASIVPAGSMSVFDITGSKVLAYSNGINWINVTTGAIIPLTP